MTLQIAGATVVFRGATAPALHEVDLDVGAGELVVVVGASGAGKTTLLRAIAGLEPLRSGRIRVGDRDVTDEAAGRRDVAMVFQDQSLYPHLTVVRNIAFPLRAAGRGRKDAEAEAGTVAETLGLSALLHRRPSDLSGGERQRVAIARALVRRPAAFLLDEPLDGLDPARREVARNDFRALQKQFGTATLFVTHDPGEAMSIADRMVVLGRGEVLQVGTPSEVYDQPGSLDVAHLLGRMSLLPGSSAAETLAIRPEALRTAVPGGGRFDATVEAVELLGGDVLIRTAGDAVTIRARRDDRAPVRGDLIGVEYRDADVHHFDEAGRRRR